MSPASRESSRSILATLSLRSAEEASGSERPVAAACLGRDTELQLQPGPSGLRVMEAKAKHAPVNAESCALPVEARSQRADLPLPITAGRLGGSSSPLLPPSAVRPALSAELLEAGVCLCKSLETQHRGGLEAAGTGKSFHSPKVSKRELLEKNFALTLFACDTGSQSSSPSRNRRKKKSPSCLSDLPGDGFVCLSKMSDLPRAARRAAASLRLGWRLGHCAVLVVMELFCIPMPALLKIETGPSATGSVAHGRVPNVWWV